MSVKILKEYGALRAVFRGSGSVSLLSDGSEVPVRFWLGQLHNAKLLVCIHIRRKLLRPSVLKAESLQGTLTDGRRINVTGLLSIATYLSVAKKTHQVVYLSSYWTSSARRIEAQAEVVFELVNFLYFGTEPEIHVGDGFEHYSRSLMALVLGGRQVQLRPVADYNQVVASLRAQHGVQVTCTATTIIANQLEIDEVVSMMDTLCSLMSVARGTLVTWISFEILAPGEVSPYAHYRSSVTRRFAGRELIDTDSTKRFLEEGFRKSKELDNDFHVDEIAHDFIETRDGAFIENRSLRIAVLVEYLANSHAQNDEGAVPSFLIQRFLERLGGLLRPR